LNIAFSFTSMLKLLPQQNTISFLLWPYNHEG